MADYFSQQQNFTNPSYASPEQLANQRAYADALQKRSGSESTRPAGAIANGLDALTAALLRNNANTTQQQAAAQNTNDVSEVISQLKNGGPQSVNPDTLGRIYANPMAAPEHRAMAGALIGQTPIKSEYGQPAQQSPIGGVVAPTVKGAYTPSYRGAQGAEGVHTEMPYPAPGISPTGPIPSTAKVVGDAEGVARGLYPPNPTPQAGNGGGAPQAGAGSPAAPPAVPNTPMTLDQLAAKGRDFAAQKAFTQGSADAQTNIAKTDIDAAATAPTIKRVAGVMLDDLHAHGDKMTFGPTAEWSNTIKKVAANYGPGLMKDQLDAIASADSFDKMSAQLTSLIGKSGGGTDAQLFNNMKSVPGAHNSKEGAEALLKMTMQVADQQQALRQATAGAPTPQAYEAARSQFFAQNPIVNPLTGNPIKLDLEKEKQASAAPAGGPPVGMVQSGYRFKGGNPNDKSSWEPVR